MGGLLTAVPGCAPLSGVPVLLVLAGCPLVAIPEHGHAEHSAARAERTDGSGDAALVDLRGREPPALARIQGRAGRRFGYGDPGRPHRAAGRPGIFAIASDGSF